MASFANLRVWFVGPVLAVLASGAAFAQQAPGRPAIRAYAAQIKQVQTELAAGRFSQARDLMAGTDEALRGFEFEYLQARAESHFPDGDAADLIRNVSEPEVETRYGVLDEANRRLAFICRDGGIVIHNLTEEDAKPRSVAHPGGAAIWSGTFSLDGKSFFSGHQTGEVLVWDAKLWEIQHTISLGEDWPVRELAAAPDGSAVVAESKQQLELWSLEGDEPHKIANVGERYNFGEGLAFSPAGDLIATGGMFDILLHDAQTGLQVQVLRHASYTMGLKFSPNGKRIASAPRGNVNKLLAVFEINSGRRLFNAGPFASYVTGMAFTPDGRRIAATGCEKQLKIFDAGTGEIVLTLERPKCGSNPAFSHDGRLLGWSEPGEYVYIELPRPSRNPGSS